MRGLTRRGFLGGMAAGAVLLMARSLSSAGRFATTTTSTAGRLWERLAARVAPAPAVDPRVARVIELSRDPRGVAHVLRVAFVDGSGVVRGTLPVSADEAAALRGAIASRDFAAVQARGLVIGGEKFVFVREAEDGAVVHAVRRGEFVTVRATADGLIVATSGDGLAHTRAVEAVYQYAHRTSTTRQTPVA